MSTSKERRWAKAAQRNIDVTFTRKGTIFLTAPCGWWREFPGDTDEKYVRVVANIHREACCRTARLHISKPDGEYVDPQDRKVEAS